MTPTFGPTKIAPLEYSDIDPEAVAIAQRNAAIAGVAEDIRFLHRPLTDIRLPKSDLGPGLVVSNPPYGVRLPTEDLSALRSVVVPDKESFPKAVGHRLALLTPETSTPSQLGHRAAISHRLKNGALNTRLFVFEPRG